MTATGAEPPALTEKGKLPQGLHFKKGKGSAVISGTPKSKRIGHYPLVITASDSGPSKTGQSFLAMVSP